MKVQEPVTSWAETEGGWRCRWCRLWRGWSQLIDHLLVDLLLFQLDTLKHSTQSDILIYHCLSALKLITLTY